MNSFTRLTSAVRHLGLRVGFRFWSLENQAIRDPDLALRWADNCEREGKRLMLEHPIAGLCFLDWANRLRENRTAYMDAKQFADTVRIKDQ